MEAAALARQGIALLEDMLTKLHIEGVSPQDVASFFSRYRPALENQLRARVEAALEPASRRLDREYRGRWHQLTAESLSMALDKARRDGTGLDWWLTRIPIHRPDLFKSAEEWVRAAGVIMPVAEEVPQLVPGDEDGQLVIYDVAAKETAQLPKVIGKDAFARFAELAYPDNDAAPGDLLDIAAGWFGRQIGSDLPEDVIDLARLDQFHSAIAARSPGLTPEQIQPLALDALLVRRRLLHAAGLSPQPIKPKPTTVLPVDLANAPTPDEIMTALHDAQVLRTPAERTAANLRAINIMDHPGGDQKLNWRLLMDYTGWGGLSLDAVRDEIPEKWIPEDRSLIHEYYTPVAVALAIARMLLPWIPALPRMADGFVMAVEPSAGIGRLVNAGSTPGFEMLSWSVIEYSKVSAAMLQAIRPDLQAVSSSFEEWVQRYERLVSGKIGLILSNPPYGERGATYTIDKNKEYRETKAYIYFLRRGLDLLAEGGIGVFLIPYGFMTGTSAAFLRIRETVLRRHHLRAAFRLPSDLFPGALLVTDLVIFESRGGELPAVLGEDQYIAEGKYFDRHPQHILGKEVGTSADEDDHTAKPRWGYQVVGAFEGLPPFEPRLRCLTCQVAPVAAPRPSRATSVARKEFEELPQHVQAASVLGERVRRYLELLTSGEHASIGRASALQPDLIEALNAWASNLGQLRNPWQEREIQLAAKGRAEIVSFLSGFDESGAVIAQIAARPTWEPKYEGPLDDIARQAEWLYSVKRELTLDTLAEFRKSLGVYSLEPLNSALLAAGWCYDDGRWLPARDYYSGLLWDRFDRARLLAQSGDSTAATQLARLTELLRPSRIEEIDPEPRMPWIPLFVLTAWLERWTGRAPPNLEWRDGLLQPTDFTYHELAKKAPALQAVAIGYINHDLEYFKPPYRKLIDPITGDEESAEQALDRARVEYNIKAKQNFKEFVSSDADAVTQIESAYNRMFKGYIMPEYGTEEIPIARWGGRITLKPHQNAGARRLIANNGGLLGFDVGVGKTYTGIATIARLRQEGRARRPIVLVPNTIIWKWHKEFRAALPDFRVLVVGSNRYLGRNGLYASKIDTPEERALKWRQFQAGEYDVALVTYSVFPRTQIRAESLRQWVYETPVILRKLALDARELEQKVSAGQTTIKKKARVPERAIEKLVGAERYKQLTQRQREEIAEQLNKQKEDDRKQELDKLLAVVSAYSELTERNRAIFGEALDRWIAVRMEINYSPDPGIYFEDLGCDMLMVDEAQNFKNLWPVAQREGGVPKYLGAISEGSDRAYALAIRAHLVRKKNDGSGVFLLSATPAKNSPLEYFTLLGYVDAAAWSRLGITDPEVFIDRYLRLEVRDIVSPDMSIVKRSVVAGFRNLDELRSVIFRFAEFRTAQEVGLKLPKSEVDQIVVPMDERQERKYGAYARQYGDALKRAKEDPRARLKALGLLQRMALVAIHPELDQGPQIAQQDPDAEAVGIPEDRTGWTYQNAVKVSNPACPKLDAVRTLILRRPDCGHLVFCDNVAVHRWLKMLLVDQGFPEGRIAVFNATEARDPAKRQSLAERFNGSPPIVGEDGVVEQEAVPPEFDVVIANATAYEGIDLHVRTCMVYHIDLPWEPATLQQRNGRAVRQGNTESVIGIRYLFSDRSLDAIRFSMISGKLGWMRDLLASADRETNNPAAQSEFSAEEMVLFLARDPEEARRAIEEQKALLEREQQNRVREQAWTSLRGLISRTAMLSKLTDPAELRLVNQDITNLSERIAMIPSTVWPWHFLLPLAKEGRAMLLGSNWALLADSFVVNSDGRGFEAGQIKGEGIGIRNFGEAIFAKYSRENLSASTIIDADSVEHGPSRWDVAKDREAFLGPLTDAISRIAGGEWEKFGLESASRAWRKYLIESHWTAIVEAIRQAGRGMDLLLPIRTEGDSLALQDAAEADLESLIPFDLDLWVEYCQRGVASDERWTDLNETSLSWWGKPYPRGLLKRAAGPAEISIQTAEGTVQVKPLFVEGALAVTFEFGRGLDSPDGARYTVTHVPSGLAVFAGFQIEEVALAALRYAATQRIDWTQEKPDLSQVDARFAPTMAWLRDQAKAPKDEAISRYAQGK